MNQQRLSQLTAHLRTATTRLAIMVTLLAVGTTTLKAQHAADVDRTALQRLLVAEDARGKGADGLTPLLDGLTSRDTLLRRVAVRGVGRLQRPDLAKALMRALTDSVPAIRAEAAIAITQSMRRARRSATADDSTELSVGVAEKALVEAIARERDATVAGAIAEALGRLPLPDTVSGRMAEGAILDRARSSLDFGIVHGLYWLALNRRVSGGLSSPGVDLLRSAALTAPDTMVRRISVLALGLMGALDSATVFAAGSDRDDQVRRLALAGAGALSPATRAEIVRRGLADRSSIVRVDAVGAARAGRDRPDCTPIRAATNDPDPYVALTAIDALGSPCADSAAVAMTLVAIVNRPPTVQPASGHRWQYAAHAIVALSRIDASRASVVLDRFAASRRWEDRVFGAAAATNLSNTRVLLRLAADTDDNVREAAIAGLAKTMKHEADSVYVAALASRGNQVVLAAAVALAGSHHQMARAALLDAFDGMSGRKSENARDPRLAVLKRIGEISSASDSARLAPYVADFDTTVALTAATILSRWTGRTVEAHPVPLPIRPEPLADIFLARDIRLRVTMAQSSGGGSFLLRLFPDEAPATVARIIRLARTHYYDGHIFQRVEPNFVIQGGGPGASEYVGDSTFMRDELMFHSHFRGTVGISSRGRDTGDAQLFINLVDNSRLDHEFTVFGQVIGGMDVVDRILEGDVIARMAVTGAP